MTSKMLGSEKELISSIQEFYKKLENDTITKAVQEKFFGLCEGFAKLPSKCDITIIDWFLVWKYNIWWITLNYRQY